jgi:hypothetical protein
MKASEMICLLAKQIQLNGDRGVSIYVDCFNTEIGNNAELCALPKSVTWDAQQRTIEIYGE